LGSASSFHEPLPADQFGQVGLVGNIEEHGADASGQCHQVQLSDSQDPQELRERDRCQRCGAPATDVDASRLGLRLSPADMADFRAQLRSLLDDFADRPDDPSAPAWSVFVVVHPDPNRQ
jgi:hypothetical protein